MSVTTTPLLTDRGDELTVTLFQHAGETPKIMISLDDADETLVPTAELTLDEASELREILRKFCEAAQTSAVHRGG